MLLAFFLIKLQCSSELHLSFLAKNSQRNYWLHVRWKMGICREL